MTLRLVFKAAIGQFDDAMAELERPIAEAATAAMRDVADLVKNEGRASIARAGFSARWQNTLRAEVYPQGSRPSMKPAAWIFHKIPYAIVFEQGATIRGRPRLWLPLSSAPKKIGRKSFTPKNVSATYGDILFPIKRASKTFLAARVRVPKSQVGGRISVTPAMLRQAVRGRSNNPLRGLGGGSGVLTSVPLFHGVDSVKLRKRFNVAGAAKSGRKAFAAFYLKNFRGE